jgi:3-methyladenine DNA glycosylase/8-oxoguanine DNA glycosylase
MARVLSEWIGIPVSGAFDLAASARFLEGFTPAGRTRESLVDSGGSLRLAFPASPSWRPVGVLVRQAGPDAPVSVRLLADPADVEDGVRHVRRILSLDVDGAGFAALAGRDAVVGRLQAGDPGLRPVLFHSPYEAACWAILSQRVRIGQACALREQIARRVGDRVAVPAGEGELSGIQLDTFPAPRHLLELDRILPVNDVKSRRLRAVAEAALAGELEAERLRSMSADEALRELSQLPGIGPFSSQLVLLRGAGHPDVFATAEPRLHDEITDAYRLAEPSVDELERVAEGWRPYRTWVSVLLRARRERGLVRTRGPGR